MKNGMIRIGMFEAYLERMLIRGLKVAYISYFTRTLQEAKAIASTMCTTEQNTIWLNNNGPEKRYNVVGTYKAYYVPIMRGKERFYHGVILNAAIGNELFVSKEETAGEELYEILMKKYPLPLLKWWGKPILSYALKEGLINAYSNRLYTECIETEYSLQGTDDMREMQIYDLAAFDYEALKSAIQVLFQEKQIWISKKEQRSINFSSMDEYFRQYGSTLVENLENLLSPESELKGEVDAFTLNSIRLYPQQAAMVNGVTTHLLNGSKDGVEVFITNPKLIETGVDLCWTEGEKKYNYPTLIFYQLGYSLFTVWQASRRHYRMNQTMECRTYYMAYEGTAQAKVIELIAEKQVATAAIQGKFSVEGISAMAEGVDARVALASSLADQDVKSGSALQKMFDVLHSSDKQAESYVTMQVYEELLGKEEVERRKKAKEDELFENLFGQWDEDFMDLQEPENEEPAVVVPQKQPMAGMANIFSLFDF